MLTRYATYTAAVVALVKRGGFPNSTYTMRNEDNPDECTAIAKAMYEGEADGGALLAGEFATHLMDGGLWSVVHVEQDEAHLGHVWVWMNEDGDIERAYA